MKKVELAMYYHCSLYISMKLKKKFRPESDGFVFSIVIYRENNGKNHLTLLEDIIIDGQYYGCDRDYCGDMLKLYDSFQT